MLQQRGAIQVQQAPELVQRKCGQELGTAEPGCQPSEAGIIGWPLRFSPGCDELLPGQQSELDNVSAGSSVNIHGYASSEGDPAFNDQLSCHRANAVADLISCVRQDCEVLGTFRHGASPATGPGTLPDPHPHEFWRTVIVEEVKGRRQPGETGLDPYATISQGWRLLDTAKADPSQANLNAIATTRTVLKVWLTSSPTNVAPEGAQLDRRDLDDYRRYYASAESLWAAIDEQFLRMNDPRAKHDTCEQWAEGSGPVQDPNEELHARGVPRGVRYHVDMFGEGRFPGAINIGNAPRSTTTGIPNTRVPNFIYREFSDKDIRANKIPIADHTADLVSGPHRRPGDQ